MSSFGMMPPPVMRMSSRPCVAQQLEHAREQRHVRAAQDRQADDVDVLLHRGGGDHLGRLVQAGVDDFHPGVAQRGGDDLGAAIVAVEAGLRYQNTDGTHSRKGLRRVTDSTASRQGGKLPRATRQLALARDEQHLARPPAQRPVAPAVVRLLDDEPRVEAELGQPRGGVEADAMLALPAPRRTFPRRCRS